MRRVTSGQLPVERSGPMGSNQQALADAVQFCFLGSKAWLGGGGSVRLLHQRAAMCGIRIVHVQHSAG